MNNKTTKYLKLGLIAMSKATTHGSWFFGHVGAEILTNCFFIDEFCENEALEKVIFNRINKVVEAKPVFFDDANLFNKQSNLSTGEIENCLQDCVSHLSTSGHGVIYGTLVLKAIRELQWLPNEVNKGLLDLLKNAQKDHPDRYFEHYDYKNKTIVLDDIPNFKDVHEAANYCLNIDQPIYENQKIGDNFYFFEGNKLHDITYAQALVLLAEMGYTKMASSGLNALRQQIKLGNTIPPNKKSINHKINYSPLETNFWTRQVSNEHHFKLAYSVIYLLKHFEIEDREAVLAKVSAHWSAME